MKIEVEITSEEIIKPSSVTPDHLRRYYLDQISPKVYIPFIFFYELSSESEISEISSRIKKSLSDALALYYPLAGRVRDDRFVECNDEGIPFSEARVSSPRTLSEVMENPDLTELSKLLPLEASRVNEFVAGIRLSTFSSFGLAVGICVSHQLGDGLSCVTFIKSLAALSRGGCNVEKPQFVSAELFPPRDDPGYDPNARITTAFAPKRFFFAPPAIEAVRKKYGRVSQVEALSAFILSRILVAAAGRERVVSVVMVVSPINIRGKLDPPLLENSFGNLYRPAFTFIHWCNDDDEFGIAKKMKEGTMKVDRGYVERMRQCGEDESVKVLVDEKRRAAMEGGEFVGYNLTSICRYPLYDTDFGYGDPLWVAMPPLPFDNNVTLLDSKRRHGIEAYVNLKPEIMAKLEADVQFLQYASAIRPRM